MATGDYFVRVYGYPPGNGSFNTSRTYSLTANTTGPGWVIKTYRNGSPVRNIPQADAIISTAPIASSLINVADLVGFNSGEGTGHFSVNYPVPGISQIQATDDYAVQRTGLLVVTQGGTYTFGLNTDDGARLKINGINLITDDVIAPSHDSSYVSTNLAAGLHTIEWTWFNAAGGVSGGFAVAEAFAAPGVHSGFNSSFKLVGDSSGLLVVQGVSLPTILAQPQDRSVTEGASAVFSVTAGGAVPLGYRWQRNGTDLPGANTSSYVTPPVTLADSGAQFRVIVTNAFGAVTSTWATLTVNAANTITWTGAVSSDWDNPTNWSPRTVPTASDRVVINSGSVNVSQPSFPVLVWNGGTLNGSLTNKGTLNWTGGLIGGVVAVANGAVLNITGSQGKILNGTINNSGVVNLSGAGALTLNVQEGQASGINNLAGGVFDMQSDITFQWGYQTAPGGTAAFNNAGVFRKSGGTGTTSFPSVSGISFNNAGTVEVQSGTFDFGNGYTQTAGNTVLDGGSLSAGSPIYLNGGRLSGNGVINAAVVNAAEISPGASPGTITINGSYMQVSARTLKIEIGGRAPGSQHDRLIVNGPATLAGTMNVTLLNGFTPSLGDDFSVLGYGSRNGNFASVVQPGLPTGLAFTPVYGPSALMLQVANLIGGAETNTFNLAAGPGMLELRFPSGPLGLYRFQASSNLVDWVDLSSNTPPGEVFRFVDLDASDLGHRFYRAVSP